jgi:hypothetical protein
LVVDGGVEGEVAEEFAGDGVDDSDVEVLDEQDDAGSGVCSADADVVQTAVMADGHGAGFIDAVVANPVVGVWVSCAGREGFGQGLLAGGWGGPVG